MGALPLVTGLFQEMLSKSCETTIRPVYTYDMENTQTTQALIQFKVGEQLSARSLCDYDCIFRFEVISRTAKFVTLKYFNDTKRVGIKVRNGREYCSPLGVYSMSPTITAGEVK
jgi:hypothetical protein